MKRKKTPAPEPTPVRIDSRTAFAIYYFASKKDAATFDKIVRKRGDTYNGGWFHGRPCGRDETWDYVDPKHGQLYAVTS